MSEKLLLIIPAYNEEENIVRVVGKLKELYDRYDYIIINDGSKDNTSALCHEMGYRIVDLPVNNGLEGAFQTGMKYALQHGYDYAMQFDADGQHKPEYIDAMLEEIRKGYDIVIGSRFVTEPKPFTARMLGSRLIAGAIRLTTGKKIADPTSGMRLYGKEVFRRFASGHNYGPEPDTISFLMKQGIKVSEVQVDMDERIAGTSYLNLTRSAAYMARMLISILLIQGFRKR